MMHGVSDRESSILQAGWPEFDCCEAPSSRHVLPSTSAHLVYLARHARPERSRLSMKLSVLPLLLLSSLGATCASSPPIQASVTSSWPAPKLAVQYL